MNDPSTPIRELWDSQTERLDSNLLASTQNQVIALRVAQPEDARRIWEWRNQPHARKASVESEPIPWQAHERWFSAKLGDPRTRILVVVTPDGASVGYLRLDLQRADAVLSVALDPAWQGRGLGPFVIAEGSRQALALPQIERVVAYVKPDNQSSRVSFERAGFVASGRLHRNGVDLVAYVYTPPGDSDGG